MFMPQIQCVSSESDPFFETEPDVKSRCKCDLSFSDGAVRLVGGAKGFEGRLEVHYRGQWGTVCDDGWTQTNTQVVCRQQGFR